MPPLGIKPFPKESSPNSHSLPTQELVTWWMAFCIFSLCYGSCIVYSLHASWLLHPIIHWWLFLGSFVSSFVLLQSEANEIAYNVINLTLLKVELCEMVRLLPCDDGF